MWIAFLRKKPSVGEIAGCLLGVTKDARNVQVLIAVMIHICNAGLWDKLEKKKNYHMNTKRKKNGEKKKKMI